MKILIRIFLLTTLILSASIVSGAEWEFDDFLKFQICYYPTNDLLNINSTDMINVESAGNSQPYAPDITNINLKAFLGLGFNVKEMPDSQNYNFYLKLFKFPSQFNVLKTTGPIIKEYHLDEINDGELVKRYLSESKNVLVKLGFIDKSSRKFNAQTPYPAFRIQNTSDFQILFNKNIPFASIYTIPSVLKTSSDENTIAKNSTEGNLAFYKELLDSYNKNLKEITGSDSSYFYFKDISSDSELVVLKISKTPMIFQNWKDLPMPQDPQHIFLTSLALVQRNTYEKISKDTPPKLTIDSDEFSKFYKRTDSTIMELASVVYLKKE